MKKKFLFGAAAAAAMIALPTAAHAGGGYLGLEYLTGESDVLLGSADSSGWQGEGAWGFGGSGWGGQIDGQFGNLELDGTGLDFDTWSAGGHLWWQNPGWRLGAVIVHSDADAGSGFDADETSYGVEGTWDLGSSAVVISSLTMGSGSFIGSDYDSWNWDAGINFYASPNLRFGGQVGIGNVEFDGGSDGDSLSFGVNGEWQPWSAPVSITAGWNTYQIDDFDVDGNMFHIGARWNFGGGTVRDRDNAAPFDTHSAAIQRSLGSW